MVQFIRENNRYVYRNEQGEQLAEITFQPLSKDVIEIDHTFVNPVLRGQGIAKQLVDTVVTEAREKQLKIKPTCPYVKKLFEQGTDYLDVYAK